MESCKCLSSPSPQLGVGGGCSKKKRRPPAESRIPPLGSGTEGPSQQSQEVKQECKWGKKALSLSSAATPTCQDPPTHSAQDSDGLSHLPIQTGRASWPRMSLPGVNPRTPQGLESGACLGPHSHPQVWLHQAWTEPQTWHSQGGGCGVPLANSG